jgi:hypothetical protein
LIWLKREAVYFSLEDWTTQITLMVLAFLSSRRTLTSRQSRTPRNAYRRAFAATTEIFCSIKLMEMMDRSVAVADVEAVGGRDRGAHPGLGVANRGFQVLALGKAGGNG